MYKLLLKVLFLLVLMTFFCHFPIVAQSTYTMSAGTYTITTCSAVIYDNGGPTEVYSSNSDDTLIVYPASTGCKVSLSGTYYTENVSYDYIKIYNGVGTSGTELATLDGNSSVAVPIVSTANNGALTIVFHSDGSIQHSGFEFQVRCVGSCACGGPFGVVATTGDHSVSLSWDALSEVVGYFVECGPHGFTPGNGTQLYTNTSYYDFQNLTNGMEYDFYVWFDCGNDQQITTEIPARVSAIPGIYVMSAGMHTITACSGTVYDNGGPAGEYTSYNQDTLIIYPATSECKIALEGTYHTESVSFDYIKVFSGAGVSGTLLATLAGNSSLAVPIVSDASNGALTVVFKSDGSVQYDGYELRIQCVCNTVRIFDTVCYRGRYQAHGYDTTFYYSGDYELVRLGLDGTLTEVHLHVRPKADVFVAGAYYFCSQGNIMLTANNAVSYLWSTGATTQSISVNSIGSYQVTITDVHGCTASASHKISPIEDFIQLISFPDMCAGNSYTIVSSHESGSEIVLSQNQSTLSSSDTAFLPDGIPCEPHGCSYRSTLTFTDFSDNARVASVEDIYYVKINLEHSYIGDIYINITCPNGQKADVLRKGASVENTDCVSSIPESAKDWSEGANSTYADFGQANPNRDTQYPCDRNVSLNAPGTGWNYCWSNNTTQGYVYAADGGFVYRSANIHSSIVDSSDVAAGAQFYHPDESFQSLVGCPLNGDWYIEVVDGYSIDNGYIFGWELALTEELLSSNAFHVSQIVPDDIWTTVVSDSSFTISPPATLQQDTTLQYSLHFYDSGGCSFDTIVPVHVYAQHDVEVWEYACNSYTWNGVTYTSTPAMPLTHTYQTAAGCDSLVTLHLTVGNVEASVSNDGPYCVGDTIHLICEDPQDDVSYSWTGPNGWVSSEVNPIIYPASLEMNGTYMLVKTLNGDYCSAQASTTVQVDQINTSVHVSPSDTICVGDEVILTVDCISEDSILFSEGFAAILTGDDDSGSGSYQKYQCTLPNFPNCDNEHVFLAGGHLRFGDVHSGGGGYITSRSMDLSQPFTVKMWMRGWNNSNEHPWFYLKVDNDTVMQQYIPVSDFSDPYTEYDYVSLTGATANSTITIGNTDLRQRFFIDSVVVVQNGECQYSWSTGATTNSITVSPSQSTDYYVTVTSAAGCAEVDTFSIVVNLRPVVTFDPCGGTCAIPSMMMDCHDGIVLPPAVPCASNYEFAGWSTTPVNAATSTEPTPLYLAGEQYLASTDITLYAVYKICEMVEEVRYAKVTAAPANWSGEYLIAYHDGGLVFDGSLTALDAVNNNHSVTFNGNYVNNAAALAPYTFTISQGNSNTCTIRSASGYYIGQNTDANGMLSSQTTQYDNTISYNGGDIDIVGSGGAYLRFNSAANQNRFRYYKSATYTGQKAIQLYRKELVEVEGDCEWLSYPSCPVSIAVATNSDPNGACDPQAIVPPIFTVTDACFDNPTATVTPGGVEGQGCDRSQTWTATYENACGGNATPVSVTYTWKVSPDPVDFSSIICENESVVLFDTVLATSGIYTRTGTSSCGCDSVVTLHLTVNHDTTVVITKDTCDWYQWHNIIYRQSGRYEWHGETAQGCDSTEVLWLTIRKSTYGILNAEVCEDDLPLVLYGQTFTESVMSNAVISNAAGCDSLILINVTVKYNTYSDLYDTIVENSLPYDTLGMHFTETGTQTDTIPNVAGCDSIVTFHLQVWPNVPITELDTVVCEGALPLVWHDSLFTVAGQKTVTLHTQHGADSVVTMHLTVNPMYDIQEAAIVSQGDLPYLWHGRAFGADTTVCDTLRTQAGCDSVVCLDLTVTAYNVEDTIIALCPGETYPWHGQTLSEARSYRDTILSENTIYIATVTLNPTYSVTNPVIVPQSQLPYLWHGRAFSADTTVCDTLRTQAGCDSVVCLNLTVTAYNVEDTAIALCPGEIYPWHNQTLSEARSYRDTVPEENTIYIATVTINPIYSVTSSVIVPQGNLPYVWHGLAFSADTTVCDTLRTQAGCDSVVCLNLTVTAYHVEDTIIALCPGETYTWHGQILSEARSYRDTIPGENTIFIATVTLNPTYSVTDPVIIPQGQLPYVWHGRAFSADTTVCDTLRTEAGCDSVVCLDLTVTAYNVEDTAIALCPGETYPWHGQTLSEARSYRDTVPEENTIYIATVTISPTYSVTDPVIIPQGQLPYVWHGREFSADTTVCDTLRTEAGCDSVVCLELTVTAFNVEDTIIALCQGDTSTWHGQMLSEARSYRDTVPGENTIYIATVTLNPTYSVTDPVTVPQGQLPYVWHGRTFSADTTVCDTLRTEAGCDSVVCLDLAVTAYNVEDTAIALCPGETYPWHGQTLSEARSYRDTVPEENTIYIATVTISPTYSVTDPVIVPQGQLPYLWHGREFSADTMVCDTLRTVAGCDSVVCLDLTVTAYHVEDTIVALCPGETYLWHNQTLSEARSYRDTVPEENTIYIATVTINPTYSVTDPVIVPQGDLPYVWHGRAFSADTTVCDTLRTQAGCDSVVCLNLTVTSYNVEYTAITLCQGETYTWHNQILSEARSYRDTVPEENTIYIATVTLNPTYRVETTFAICENQLPYHYVNGQIDTIFDVGTPPLSTHNFQFSTVTGCDSIVTLHLTVSSPTINDIIVSSCGSFVWHGRTFTESTDTATFRITNAAGCDIIMTLHLTVNPLDSTDLYESICAGDTFDFNGRMISQEGIYRDTIHRQEACDSIVILHLTVLNPSHQSYTIERCGNYTWENGDGQTYTESGRYYYRHEDSDGCMQVDTLYLTIHPLPATPILSITPNTGCTEYNGIITVTTPVGGYLYDFDGGGFQSSNTFDNLNAGEYIVSVRDVSHGCVSTTTAVVTTAGSALTVEASGISPCEGEDMELFAETQSGGVTYLWSGPDNFTSTLQNPVVSHALPANAGVYTVVVTETATGCVASSSVTVTVNPLPVVTVSGDAMIMIGHSATLTAMGADSYLWSTGATTPVVTVFPQEMTTYTVTGTDTLGCIDTASFEVIVIYDCFLPAQNGEESVHCVSQVVPPQLPEVIACGDTIPLVAGENLGNVESGCGDSVFVYHYTVRDTQYTWTYTYHVSPDAMPLLNNRSVIISCLSDTVKPTPPVMVNSCLDTIVPIELPVEVEVTGCSGVVRYVWKYEDCAGHLQNWTFSYIIRDNIAPTFSQPGDVAICRNANGAYDADTSITGLPVSLDDNCADREDLSVSYNDLFVDNQNTADTLFRTWVVTDPCGNAARAVQKIIVYDTYHTEIHEGICGRDLPYTFNVGGRDTIISAVSSYSSTFNFPLISQHGCDSLVTLHLTVDTVAEIHEQLSICENELPYHFTYGQIDTTFEEGTPAFATYRFLIPAQGGCESIVWLALTVTPSYNVDIYESACDMYIWHNTPYRQSGSYEWHGQTVNGCDSVETLRLTIHRSSMSVQDSTVCDNDLPFVWNGVTFYEAGNGSAVLAGANAEHCDSVVLMMLHVNRTDTTVLYDTIVENQLPYYYTNGQIDTTFAVGTAQSSTFRFLLQNVSGCDSTVTLYLTMNMNVTAQADSTVCENDLPLQWNGITFTGAGTDSVVLVASNGADSLLFMHVYVNPNTSAALYDTIVENQLPYHYTNGQVDTVFAVGTPHSTTSRFMLSNANGCDSAVTLKLTVILNVSVELDSAVCPSALPLIWNGVEFSDAGTDTAVVPASTGSDSVIVMHLTLLPVQLTNLHVEVCASDFPYHFVNGQIDTVIASLATHHAVFNFLFSTQDGCDSIVRLNLSVLDTSLSVVPLSDYCDNMSTTLSALSSMENFVWSTGEISQDIEVTAPGVYSVTASTGDCQSMSSYVVDACELVLYLPNAISPGKLDGHNDCFSLQERYIGLIDEFEITIVNRWGEVVFHSNDKNFKWYGDYKGSVVRQNVYNYIIHYTELDPKKGRHHLKGALIVL